MTRYFKMLLFLTMAMTISVLSLFAGISAEPTVIEKVMEPGATGKGTYTLTNTGKNKLDITIETEDWLERLFGIKSEIKVSEWLTVEPNHVTLVPGQKVELTYQVKALIPFQNEKVAQVFFTFSETTNLTSRLGVIFYLSPKGSEKLDAEITQFTAEHEVSQEKKSRLSLWFEIKNKSNVHIRPVGSVTLMDQTEKTTLKEWIMDRVPGIYPGRTFAWSHRYDLENIPSGSYKVKVKLDYGKIYGQEIMMKKTADLDWEKIAGVKTK